MKRSKSRYGSPTTALVAYYFPGIVMSALSVLLTLVVYHFTTQISIESLRAWLTLVIMGIPTLIVFGYWLGTAQVRGYEKGVAEKIARQVPPVVWEQPPQYQQLSAPQITHQQEALDAR